jgi:hypothetical protein
MSNMKIPDWIKITLANYQIRNFKDIATKMIPNQQMEDKMLKNEQRMCEL